MAVRKTAEKEKAPDGGADPIAGRPQLPREYGVSRDNKGMLTWASVRQRLTEAQHYWICTVSPDHRPHATPVDGLWVNDRLYFGGSPTTRWHRNVSANPALCVHLESATEVVTMQGEARTEPVDRALAQRLADASKKKYGYSPKPEQYEQTGVLVFRPRVAFAWTNLPKDATRWEFGHAPV